MFGGKFTSWFGRSEASTKKRSVIGESTGLPKVATYNWCTCRCQTFLSDNIISVELDVADFLEEGSNILVAERSVSLELHYRDSGNGPFNLLDYLRRTIPLAVEVVPGEYRKTYIDGVLSIYLTLAGADAGRTGKGKRSGTSIQATGLHHDPREL